MISERRQDYQWNTLIRCYEIFTSQLTRNNNKFQQDPGLHLQPTRPSTLVLVISPSTNTQYIYNEKFSPFTEATTIPNAYYTVVTKTTLETSIQAMIDLPKQKIEEQNERIDQIFRKLLQELVNIKWDIICLSYDNKLLK